MTPLKPSEKRLLTVFGIAAFLLLNLLGYSWLNKRTLVQSRQRSTLETRQQELEMWRGKAPEAEQKREFLHQHLEAYADEATRETNLVQFVQNEAEELSLELRKNNPLPAKLEPLFHKSRYTGEVIGEWDDVLEFIYRMQAPKEFRFVPSIRLKSQKKEGATDEASNVVCTFEMEKWWSPESGAEDEAGLTLEGGAADLPSPSPEGASGEPAPAPSPAAEIAPAAAEQAIPPAVKPS